MQGIQKAILDIIKTSKDMGLPFITKSAIIEESKKTSLAVFANKHHTKDKYSELTRKVEQALFQLKKKGLIKQRKRGHWTIDTSSNKYKPVICKALEEQYEIYCPKCNKYRYEIIKTSTEVKRKCPDCGKDTQTHFYKYWCPVREIFIGDPAKQCELIHGTNMKTLSKEVFPMKICYFSTKPTKLSLEYAKEKVRKEEEKISREKRYYSKNCRDPLSKNYLPNLEKEVE